MGGLEWGWGLGRGAISLSLTAAPRRLLPPRVSSLSGCAEAHYSVDFVRHTQKPSTLACVGGGPGGGWGSMRSDISVAEELKASALTSIVVFRSSGVCIWGEIAIC